MAGGNVCHMKEQVLRHAAWGNDATNLVQTQTRCTEMHGSHTYVHLYSSSLFTVYNVLYYNQLS